MSNDTGGWPTAETHANAHQLFDPVPPAEPTPARRARPGGGHDPRRKRRGRTVAVLLVAVLLVAGAGYVVWSVVGGMFGGSSSSSAVDDYPGPGHPSARVVVKPGDSGAAIARTLTDAGVVASTGAFTTAFAADPDAASIQPGTYDLLLEMKASDAVDALLNPSSKVSMKVTIPEGYTKDQAFAKISDVTGIGTKKLDTAAKDTKAIGLPSGAKGDLEGWLFPATYQFDPGTSATAVLKEMVGQTSKVLDGEKVAKGDRETVLTKASLVEREAKRDQDRPKMARAIDNRLDHDMILQIDASVAYGAGISGKEPTQAQLDDASNPYNTYVHVGLPPGPIASPGKPSIDAVVHPAKGDWLFWETVNPKTGETKFEVTNSQHVADQNERAAWDKAHGDG